MESGRLPAVLIRPFEVSCGIDLVTRYLAVSGHKLIIDIAIGRKAGSDDLQMLQEVVTGAVGLLMRFYRNQAGREETTAALLEAMEGLAWHRENIERIDTPELDFMGSCSQPVSKTKR